MVDTLLAAATDAVKSDDPLDAEIAGASFMTISSSLGDYFEEMLVNVLIPRFEERATPEALALLLALGTTAHGQGGEEARFAADRLIQAGVAEPRWAATLNEPVTVGRCLRLGDPQGNGGVLACTFHRAGRSHSIVVTVDADDCGAADDISLIDVEHLPEILEQLRSHCRDMGMEFVEETLNADEFRWQVERALDARAVHDADLVPPGVLEMPDNDTLSYQSLLPLVQARMATLPMSNKPKPPHNDNLGGTDVLQALMRLTNGPMPGIDPFGRRSIATALPKKRKKADGPAPIYQIKVGLRGAKPPIWCRLEVPADISLGRLHTVIQIAFDWDDSHLHVFETPYGSYGMPDTNLGHQSEARVTLEQVAPNVKSKIRYTYDFGDDWEHEILVEKVLDRDHSVNYPRCIGGRRAAPPEDCGGIWGYGYLVEILSDPSHPEYEDRLEWLGLDDASQFDPAAFDAKPVTEELSALR